MGGWKSKLTLTLIIYFAGFATAIYYLAPEPANASEKNYQKQKINNTYETQENQESSLSNFSQTLKKYVNFAKGTTTQMQDALDQAIAMNEKTN